MRQSTKQMIVTRPHRSLMQLNVRESIDMMRMEQLADTDPAQDERSRLFDHGYFPKRLNRLM